MENKASATGKIFPSLGIHKSVGKGDKWECTIVELDDKHYYLTINGDKARWFDVILPREGVATLEEGDKIKVCVDVIRIADDGTPGVFVKYTGKV